MRLARRVAGARRYTLVCCVVAVMLSFAAGGWWWGRSARGQSELSGRIWRIGFHDTEPFLFRGHVDPADPLARWMPAAVEKL